MNKKNIGKYCKFKLADWIRSIKDEDLKQLVRKDTLLTGGAIASMLLGEDVKDFDIYFKHKDTAKKVAEYYIKEFNERKPGTNAYLIDGAFPDEYKNLERDPSGPETQFGKSTTFSNMDENRIKIIVRSAGVAAANDEILKEPFEDVYDVISDADQVEESSLDDKSTQDKYRPVFLSPNAITLSDKIQIVIRFHGDIGQIHENYDFVHCTNSYDYLTNEVTLKSDALEALMNKELKYIGSKYPICSVVRTRKFLKRGFQINAGQYLKMCFQISALDLTNIDVLEDQLIGVDSAYFQMLIDGLRSKEKSEQDFRVTENYITTLIDRIF